MSNTKSGYIWSLYDLLDSYASRYSFILEQLNDLKGYVQLFQDPKFDFDLGMRKLQALSELSLELERNLSALQMELSVIQCRRIRDYHLVVKKFLEEGATQDQARRHLAPSMETNVAELISRIKDELNTRKFFHIRQDLVSYYESNPFPKAVAKKFPDAVFDMEEAGECFALGRYTASVFHILRVAEVGTRHLKQHCNITKHTGTWDAVAKAVQKYIDSLDPKKDRKNIKKLGEIKERILSLKDVYRNPTTHPEKVYTEEKAKEVFDAVRNFTVVVAKGVTEF